MIIIIDTREQRPWSFPPQYNVEVGTLKTGDYALKNDDNFAIERKSADDFVGTISTGWARFCRELKRMDEKNFVSKIIIIEADLQSFCYSSADNRIIAPDHNHVRCTPQFIMKRIAQLAISNINVIFATNAELASNIALKILEERYEQIRETN